jgi:hypothetical protein
MSGLDDLGPWYPLREAAPMLGINFRKLRAMCAARQITCRADTGTTRAVTRYMLSEKQIAAYNRAHEQQMAVPR